jgi:hypothetical protein
MGVGVIEEEAAASSCPSPRTWRRDRGAGSLGVAMGGGHEESRSRGMGCGLVLSFSTNVEKGPWRGFARGWNGGRPRREPIPAGRAKPRSLLRAGEEDRRRPAILHDGGPAATAREARREIKARKDELCLCARRAGRVAADRDVRTWKR